MDVLEEDEKKLKTLSEENQTIMENQQPCEEASYDSRRNGGMMDLEVSESTEIDNDVYRFGKHPLEISVILRNILGYLDLPDMKQLSLVSKECNLEAKFAMLKCSTITFRKKDEELSERKPDDFFALFDKSSTDSSFNSFKIGFKYSKKEIWKIGELDAFFDRQRKYIRELSFSDVYLLKEDKTLPRHSKFDITPWIADTPMTKRNSKYYTKVSVENNSDYKKDHLSLVCPWDVIANIKDIHLNNCYVNIESGAKSFPTKLDLENVRFLRDNNPIPRICINDLIDFRNAKIVKLHFPTYWRQTTKISLNVEGKQDIEFLDLSGVEFQNWRTSQWSVKKLFMFNTPFTQFTNMKILKLHCHDCYLDLSAIPKSVEEITIEPYSYIGADQMICTQPIVLENLKRLNLGVGFPYSFSELRYFYNCPITDLYLQNGYSGEHDPYIPLDIIFIPRSVRNLGLKCIVLESEDGYDHIALNRLVVHRYSLRKVKRTLNSNVSVNEFVWNHICEPSFPMIFQEFWNHVSKFSSLKRIYVGPVFWDYFKFEGSPISQYVDEVAMYYLFENGRGRKIDEKEFLEVTDPITTLNNHNYV